MSTDHAHDATVVLIHGLWLTPRSWEHWITRYEARGERVLAPAWPRMEGEVDAIRANPEALGGLGLGEVADHYERLIRALDAPPIIIGHSFGGALTQVLLDRGLGSAGVALHSAPVKGVLRLPVSAVRSAFPVLRNPANRKRAVGLTPKQWHYAFTNVMSEAESQAAYERYHVPSSGRPIFQAATAILRSEAPTRVNFANANRAPLLLIAGGADHTVPSSINRENHRHYEKSTAVTELEEIPGRCHFTIGQSGWEAVADRALDWARAHASATR